MGRFSDNGLKKPEISPSEGSERSDALPVSVDVEKSLNEVDQETSKPVNQYTQAQLKPVNVGGFRVPKVVRAHWQSEAKLRDEKVATELRAFMVTRYGLPDGISEDDLLC